MRWNSFAWVAGVVCSLLMVSGCTAEKADPKAAAGPATHPTVVDGSNGTAAIDGSVVDDEARPLAAVEVNVADRANNSAAPTALSTDADGKFSVKGLAAGTYAVYAHKLGFYDPTPRSVKLAEGETQKLKLELRPLPSIVPVHNTTRYTVEFLNDVCAVANGETACGAQGYSGKGHVTLIPVKEEQSGDLMDLVAETRWTVGVGAFPAYFRTDVFSPDIKGLDPVFPGDGQKYYGADNPFHWASVPASYKSPTRLIIARDGDANAILSPERTALNNGTPVQTSGDWTVTLDYYPEGAGPAGVYVVANQPVEVFVTKFYVEAAAPGFSAISP